MTASIWPADSIGSRTAALMLLCFTLAILMPFCFATAGHSRIERSPSATPSVLALDIGQRADAAALAGDDGVGRLVEQHEHRLDRRPPCLSLSRKRISALMSTSAKSLVPAATRAIASGDPLAILVVTARPSALNRPPADAITKGAAAASIGRSSENWIASGGRGSSAASAWLAAKARNSATGRQSEARSQSGRRWSELHASGLHQHEMGQVAASADALFRDIIDGMQARSAAFCSI